ncbi:MAG: Oxidoreductase, partial [uncultured Chloroflexia bacterium]
RRRGAPHLRPVRRSRRQCYRHIRQLHQRHVRADGRRLRSREARAARPRHQVHHGAGSRRSEFRRQSPPQHRPLGRAEPKAARHRSDRSLLPAWLGLHDAPRRGHARARRPRPRGEGRVSRHLQHARMARGRDADAGGAARLGAFGGAPDRVQPGGAYGGARVAPDGRGVGAGRAALVPARRRRAHGQVHARRPVGRKRGRCVADAKGRDRFVGTFERALTRHRGDRGGGRAGERRHPVPSRARLGAGPPGCRVADHRRAHVAAGRGKSRGAGHSAFVRTARPPGRRERADAHLPGPLHGPSYGPAAYVRRNDNYPAHSDRGL